LRLLSGEVCRLRAENARLRAAEARQRAYAESAADWFWDSDAEHRIIRLSERFEAATGLSPALLLGRRPWDFSVEPAEADREGWRAHLDDFTARRPFRDFRYWHVEQGGRAWWLMVGGVPCFDADGGFLGYHGSGADLTRSVDTAHRLHMLSRAVEQSPASIVITDLAGDIQYVNAKFVEVTGYTADEVLGHNPRVLNSGLNPPGTFERMWAALSAGEPWAGELVNRAKSGALYWEQASIQPIQSIEGVVTNYLAVKSDITEQRRNEARLAALVEDLHRSNEDLEQFAYVASHDLRQPLRMISAYLGLLERRLGAGLDADGRTFLDFALDGARRLDRMIADLLRYSRIGRSDAPFAPVDLVRVVGDSRHHLGMAIAEAAAEVRVAPDLPQVPGERGELVRLFQNLIGNAIAYRQPERPPRIDVTWSETPVEWVISVSDNGVGIRAEDLTRIFGIFQRLVSREKVEGTGIGLAICRKIAEHHGGRIWAESEPGVGSTFRLAIPKPRPSAGLPAGEADAS